ncbi:hypothetical protein NDU88_000954 [Pleurodeles waltl]|uniref:Uncharacterized protein n=1 Tax=Pleurodeles waltl TaxID=8319 RepID=A0AAV7TIR1_PLEWA|nr:hypothetical protein NDU88_000954 [Pleurodeles waltl]
MANPTETASKDEEESQRSAGITDGLRATEGTKNPEPSEETLNSRHIPGGVWLNKVWLIGDLVNYLAPSGTLDGTAFMDGPAHFCSLDQSADAVIDLTSDDV